jgi:hypothetical protein
MAKDALRPGRVGLSRVHSTQFKRHLSGAIFSCPRAYLGPFSDPNLIASAGLVPLVRLAERCEQRY